MLDPCFKGSARCHYLLRDVLVLLQDAALPTHLATPLLQRFQTVMPYPKAFLQRAHAEILHAAAQHWTCGKLPATEACDNVV